MGLKTGPHNCFGSRDTLLSKTQHHLFLKFNSVNFYQASLLDVRPVTRDEKEMRSAHREGRKQDACSYGRGIRSTCVLGFSGYYNSKQSFIKCLTFVGHVAGIISTPGNNLATEVVLTLI